MTTKHPKSGKGTKWTVAELKAVPADWAGDVLSDGGSLQGEVRVSSAGDVAVRFRYCFRWNGTNAWHQCGTWPSVDIKKIREQRDTARALVKTGVNPNDQKKVDRIEADARAKAIIAEDARQKAENLSFGEMFESWLADGVTRQDGNAELRRSFGKDVLPTIGSLPVRLVDDAKLLEVLRAVGRGRGKGRTAQRMLTEVRQLYWWAGKRKPWRTLMVDGNPAVLVEPDQVAPQGYADGVRERTLSPTEIRELSRILRESRARYAKVKKGEKYTGVRPLKRESELAIGIALGTMCRIGELLKARWAEVDFEKREWHIPAANTKTKVKLVVFLSDFALRHFRALHVETGHTEWCFPARPIGRTRQGAGAPATHVGEKTVSKQIGDRQLRFMSRVAPLDRRKNDDSLVLGAGKNGEWGLHDLRRTGSTLMQDLDVLDQTINRCLNHKMRGPEAGKHYLHSELERQKRDAWQRLGKQLDSILSAASDAEAEALLDIEEIKAA